MATTKKPSSKNFDNILIWQRRIWFLVGTLILIIVLFYLLNFLKPVITPFVYALAIVYILKPIVDFFQDKGIPRIFAVILAYLLFIFIVSLFLIYIIPIIIDQFRGLISSIPTYIELIEKKALLYLKEIGKMHLPFDLKKLLADLLDRLKEPGLAFFGRIPGYTANVVSSFFNIVIAPILAFYILKDYEQIRLNIRNLIPMRYREEVTTGITKIDEVISNYLKGQIFVALIVGFLMTIGLYILGIDYALIIGMIGGIANIVPYLGPIIGAIPAIIIAFFEKPILALWVIIVMIIIQQVDSFLISPNIMKKQMDLHPALIVFALMVGGIIWGILGMLLAIPITAAGKAVMMYYIEKSPYYQEDNIKDETPGDKR